MNKVSKFSFSILKQIDYFKQPVKLLVSRKGWRKNREPDEDLGSIWGGFLTIISFTFLIINGQTLFGDMMEGKNDNIKNQIMLLESES